MPTPVWTGKHLLHPEFDDHYGVDDGGFGEAVHVFADAVDLEARFSRGGSHQVGDLGLGSGRNLLTVWSLFERVAPAGSRLTIHTFERDMLSWDHAFAALLHCWQQTPDSLKQRLDGLLDRMKQLRNSWPTPLPAVSELQSGRSHVQIVAWVGDAAANVPLLDAELDHWCLDGFSPASNPEMWTAELLHAVAERTRPGGTASTYTAAGHVRRALQDGGFAVERVRGFGRKRQMVRADRVEGGRIRRQPASRYPIPPGRPPGRVAIIGAGIAGCSVARELAERGIASEVFDAVGPAAGASGNRWGLLQPLPNLGDSPVGDWTTRAFAWTRARAHAWGLPWKEVQVARYGEKAAYAQRLLDELPWGAALEAPDRITDAPAGVILGIRTAAVIPPVEWCSKLLEHPAITLHAPHRVEALRPGWFIDEAGPFDTVVLANSWAARELVPNLDLYPVRGQLLHLPATSTSHQQTRALCGSVYLLPAADADHLLGATYDRDDMDPELRSTDSAWLWEELIQSVPDMASHLEPPTPSTAGRVSWRGVTPGRLPFVGPIDDPNAVRASFTANKQARPCFQSSAYHPGLWVSAGHGSRGLSGGPFAAKVLCDLILGCSPPLPEQTKDAVHPSRTTVTRLRARI